MVGSQAIVSKRADDVRDERVRMGIHESEDRCACYRMLVNMR